MTTVMRLHAIALALAMACGVNPAPGAAELTQPANTWVKRTPLADTPPSPRLGYEGACAWDGRNRAWLRYGGHNQGGGGEQNAEMWAFDPITAKWTFKEPNTAPPGVCCAQQNVFDPAGGRYLRFPAFSASHGWQWRREIFLNNNSVWTYDLAANLWRNLRPLPEPTITGLRCASWDSDAQVAVVFGGETNREGTRVYDPYANAWTRMKPAREPEFRSGGNMVYAADQRLHIMFGAQFSDDPHTWGYDLRRNEWLDLQPPALPLTNRNDAVLAYDSHNEVVVAIVKPTIGEGDDAKHKLETWAYHPSENHWRKMNPPQEPDVSGNRARVLGFAPELGLTLLENCTSQRHSGSREQQMWTYCYAPPKPGWDALQPPSGLEIVTKGNSATLRWEASDSPICTGYVIYRGVGAQPWLVDFQLLASVPKKPTAYDDVSLQSGAIYYYYLSSRMGNAEGPKSLIVRTQPPVTATPVVSVLSAQKVELAWQALARLDVVGYLVERAPVEVWTTDQLTRLKSRTPPLAQPNVGALRKVGAFVRLTDAPITDTKFADTPDLANPRPIEDEPILERELHKDYLDEAGKPYRHAVYAYRIRAVNALGVEGGPSPYALTIPSQPEGVFSKEDGTTCRLKWAANPEQSLRGYRVYRMDNRWDKDPIGRLTPEPVATPAFADETAGKRTRRYYVVAVDALGQEGPPSRPVWFEREWKRYYEPFTGEWHQ